MVDELDIPKLHIGIRRICCRNDGFSPRMAVVGIEIDIP